MNSFVEAINSILQTMESVPAIYTNSISTTDLDSASPFDVSFKALKGHSSAEKWFSKLLTDRQSIAQVLGILHIIFTILAFVCYNHKIGVMNLEPLEGMLALIFMNVVAWLDIIVNLMLIVGSTRRNKWMVMPAVIILYLKALVFVIVFLGSLIPILAECRGCCNAVIVMGYCGITAIFELFCLSAIKDFFAELHLESENSDDWPCCLKMCVLLVA